MTVRAIVIGTGWAGEGHVRGLRDAGVEVVALCGRTPEPAHALAVREGVPEVRFDWRQALAEFRPDLVSIATTAGPHRDIAVAAAAAGCYVVCEKPLAPTAQEVREMLAAEDGAQRQWNQFFAEVAADLRGQGPGGYPTFREGWMAVEVMDIARDGRSWTALPPSTGDHGSVLQL
jgi:hypothetical protein